MNGHPEFEALEAALPDMARTFVADPAAPHCLVVVPSMSFDQQLLRNVVGVEHYEERLLAMLLQLHTPQRPCGLLLQRAHHGCHRRVLP